jgi:hypothetical protein
MVAKYLCRVRQMGEAEVARGCYDWQVENINLEARPKVRGGVTKLVWGLFN